MREIVTTFRIEPHDKKWIDDKAKELNVSTSKYLKILIKKNRGVNNLLDGEEALKNMITDITKDVLVEPFNKIRIVLNDLKIISESIFLQNDMVYKYFNIPQKREELKSHLVSHPISEVAREEVIKAIRQRRMEKNNSDE